jgi:hypothetical protein
VHRPDLARPEAETLAAGVHQQGRVVPGPAPARLADLAPCWNGWPLRAALSTPAPGQVEQLGGAVRHRQQRRHAVDGVVPVAGVRHLVPDPQHARGLQPQPRGQAHAVLGVRGLDHQLGAAARQRVLGDVGDGEPGEAGRAVAVAGQPRPPGPAVRFARQQAQPELLVGAVVRDPGPEIAHQGDELVRFQRPRIAAPVQHLGQPRTGQVEQHGRTGRAQ